MLDRHPRNRAPILGEKFGYGIRLGLRGIRAARALVSVNVRSGAYLGHWTGREFRDREPFEGRR